MEDTVKINAGGQKFETLRKTLTNLSTYFRSKLGRWDSGNTMFVDVDPDDFRLVLNFLRDQSNPVPKSNLIEYFGIEIQLSEGLPEKAPVNFDVIKKDLNKNTDPSSGIMMLVATSIHDTILQNNGFMWNHDNRRLEKLKANDDRPEPQVFYERATGIYEIPLELNGCNNIYRTEDVYSGMVIKIRVYQAESDFDKFSLIDQLTLGNQILTKTYSSTDLRIYHHVKGYEKFDSVEAEHLEYYLYIPMEQKLIIGEKECWLTLKSSVDSKKIRDLKFQCKLHFLDADERQYLVGSQRYYSNYEWNPATFHLEQTQKISDTMYKHTYGISTEYITKMINFYLPDTIICQLEFGYFDYVLISMNYIDLERYQIEHNFDYQKTGVFSLYMLPHVNLGRIDRVFMTLITNQKDVPDSIHALNQYYCIRGYSPGHHMWMGPHERLKHEFTTNQSTEQLVGRIMRSSTPSADA